MIVDQLSSLADDLAALEPWRLTGDEVREVVVAVQRTRTALDATMSRLVGCVDQMGLAKDDGAASTTAWLSAAANMTKGAAAKLVGLSKGEGCVATREAWSAGRLSTDQAAVIIKAIGALPDRVDEQPRTDAEAHLIGLAGEHDLEGLQRLAHRVLEVIDPDGYDEHLGEQLRQEKERARVRTRFTMGKRGDGTSRGIFVLGDTDADVLRAAIEGIIAPRRNAAAAESFGMGADDWANLPRDQKMGHAFAELVNYLPADALPVSGGLAATVAVTIDADTLATGTGTGTNTSGTTMSATKAQRIACNAHLVALLLDGDSRVIDHGTTRRLYDRHQRLILATRDGGCVFPRTRPWADRREAGARAKPAAVRNEPLVRRGTSRAPHHLVHEGQWTARMADDGVVEVIPTPHIDPDQTPQRHSRFTRQHPRAG